jgi:hypothetical protein
MRSNKGPVLACIWIGVILTATQAAAMPMFARKLGVPCSTCHTTIPRLNETGFKFRAAGWRLPDDIGKPETKPFNLGDYFSGRRMAWSRAIAASCGSMS